MRSPASASARCTNEENYLFQKFMRAVVGHQQRRPLRPSLPRLHGDRSAPVVRQRRHDQLVRRPRDGAGASWSSAPTPARRTPSRRCTSSRRCAAGASADRRRPARDRPGAPRATSTCSCARAPTWPLLNGLMHVIVAEGLADEAFIAARTEDFEAFARRAGRVHAGAGRPRSPACPPSGYRAAARLFATAERAAIVYSMGITQHSHGTDHVLAVSNLAMLTGNVGKRGRRRQPAARPEQRAGRLRHGRPARRATPATRGSPTTRRGASSSSAWGVAASRRSRASPSPRSFDAMHDGRAQGAVRDGREPDAVATPTSRTSRRRSGTLDFLVVQDIFLTETASLPTSSCRRPASPRRTAPSPTPSAGAAAAQGGAAPGEARADWQIICELAARAWARPGLQDTRRHLGRDGRPSRRRTAASPTRASSAGRPVLALPQRRAPRHADPARRHSSRAARAASSRSPISRRTKMPTRSTR